MTVQSKIRRKPVALRKSRIRREPLLREPVRILSEAELRKAEAKLREREVWSGVAGVLLFGAGIAAAAIAVGVMTFFQDDPAAAAKAARFEQCYNANGANCVVDGDTIYVGGEKVQIAGIEAPAIQDAKCEAERSRGIDATTRLSDLLNGGNVTVSRTFRDASGRTVRKVLVNGEDAGQTMISAGVAREAGSNEPDWCAPAVESSDTDA